MKAIRIQNRYLCWVQSVKELPVIIVRNVCVMVRGKRKHSDSVDIYVLGPVDAGKSSLTGRFIQGCFSNYQPYLEESYLKQVCLGERVVCINVTYSAKLDEYEMLREMFLRDTEGILFCVPMTNRRKFDRFAFYCQSMLNKRSGELPKVIAGTMCDLNTMKCQK